LKIEKNVFIPPSREFQNILEKNPFSSEKKLKFMNIFKTTPFFQISTKEVRVFFLIK